MRVGAGGKECSPGQPERIHAKGGRGWNSFQKIPARTNGTRLPVKRKIGRTERVRPISGKQIGERQPLTEPANMPRTKKRCSPKKTSIGTMKERKAAPVRMLQLPPRGSIKLVI